MPPQRVRTRKPLFSGQPFEQVVGILIAAVTIQAALTAFLQSDASAASDRATRDAQQYAIQALGREATGRMETGFAHGDAYRRWLELDVLAYLAAQRGDMVRSNRYYDAEAALVDSVPVLAGDYYDLDDTFRLDTWGYELDTYVRDAARLNEWYDRASALGDAWDRKASSYVTHLTLLAVCLFLYGISTTIGGGVRWVLVVTGSLLAVLVFIWMLIVLIAPVQVISEEAIEYYVEGVSENYLGNYTEAIDSFTQALALNPDYIDARLERASAYYYLDQLESAVSDYQAVIEAGDPNLEISASWNLGWTYYRLGRYADGLAVTEPVIERAGFNQVPLTFNLAAMSLVSGDFERAARYYDEGIEIAVGRLADAEAAGQAPPSSFWTYLDLAADDLNDIQDCLRELDCENSPPTEAISRPDEVAQIAAQREQQLRSLAVALQYTGALPQPAADIRIDGVRFAQVTIDEEGGWQTDDTYLEFFPADTHRLALVFDYEDILPGSTYLIRVYYEENEDDTLRVWDEWALEPSGTAEYLLDKGDYYTLAPGEWRVELYVDWNLIGWGEFEIVP